MSADASRPDTSVPGIFLVTATVRQDLRLEFDAWYEAEHLPQAREVLGAVSARRAWSKTDPGQHHAIYEFDDVTQIEDQLVSPGLRMLVAEFDRVWPAGVERSREVLEVRQHLRPDRSDRG